MLVLSRKMQETIVIDGGRIVVKVISARGKAVRIGIQAASDIRIQRGELVFDNDFEATSEEVESPFYVSEH